MAFQRRETTRVPLNLGALFGGLTEAGVFGEGGQSARTVGGAKKLMQEEQRLKVEDLKRENTELGKSFYANRGILDPQFQAGIDLTYQIEGPEALGMKMRQLKEFAPLTDSLLKSIGHTQQIGIMSKDPSYTQRFMDADVLKAEGEANALNRVSVAPGETIFNTGKGSMYAESAGFAGSGKKSVIDPKTGFPMETTIPGYALPQGPGQQQLDTMAIRSMGLPQYASPIGPIQSAGDAQQSSTIPTKESFVKLLEMLKAIGIGPVPQLPYNYNKR